MRVFLSTVIILLLSQPIFSQIPDYVSLMKCDKAEFETKNFYVVNFWTSYCSPCIRSFSQIQAIRDNIRRNDIGFISITNQSEEKVNDFISKNNLFGCVGIDKDFQLLTKYGYETLPRLVIIDNNGKILWSGMPFELKKKMLYEVVEKEVSDDNLTSFHSTSTLEHSQVTDSSHMGHSENSKFREVVFTNHSITGIYSNMLKLREESNSDLFIKGSPRYEGKVNYHCKVDVGHYTSKQFYNYCIDNLNAAYNATLRDTFVPSENLYFNVINTQKLSHHKSTEKKESINIDKTSISLYNTTLRKYFKFFSAYYDIYYEVGPKVGNFDDMRYDFEIKRVSLPNLNNELQELGLNMEVKDGMRKEYVLYFN